jgi:kinesin family protein 5
MESIKKLEEKWMMNQQKHAAGENIPGLKDESSNVISNGKVVL